MKENDRNQQQTSTDSMQNQDLNNQQTQNTSGQGGQDQNPQEGTKWSNYRTRELSDEGTGEGNATTPGNE
jgi:hypothetical protein